LVHPHPSPSPVHFALKAKVFRPAGLKERGLTSGRIVPPFFTSYSPNFTWLHNRSNTFTSMLANRSKVPADLSSFGICFDVRSLKRTAETKYLAAYGLSVLYWTLVGVVLTRTCRQAFCFLKRCADKRFCRPTYRFVGHKVRALP
jgi:hypothetical protein